MQQHQQHPQHQQQLQLQTIDLTQEQTKEEPVDEAQIVDTEIEEQQEEEDTEIDEQQEEEESFTEAISKEHSPGDKFHCSDCGGKPRTSKQLTKHRYN